MPIRLALSLGVLLGVGSVGSYAYWTRSVTVPSSSFTAGNLDLLVNATASDVVTFSALSLGGMAPGNTTAGVLTVKNAGSVTLKYTVATGTTNVDGKGLAAALTGKVTGAGTVTGTAPTATCSGTALSGTASGFTTDLVTTGRVLAPNTSETLCVQAGLPATAANTLQTAATTITLTFHATSKLT